MSTLKKMREDSSNQFHSLFAETFKLGQQLHRDLFELSTPRIVGRQVHQSNRAVSSPEDYYRITLFDEFLSHVISQLEDRFVLTTQLILLLLAFCTFSPVNVFELRVMASLRLS